jgi:hypothetical protein
MLVAIVARAIAQASSTAASPSAWEREADLPLVQSQSGPGSLAFSSS